MAPLKERWSGFRYNLRSIGLNRFYRRWIEKFYKGKGSLLDIGCGNASFISYMKGLGWKVFGVEIDRSLIKDVDENLKPSIKLINSRLNEASFKENSFDIVTLWNVFEHIGDSEALLGEIKKILKNKGLLFIQIPNIKSLESDIFNANWVHLDRKKHIHHFSPDSILTILGKNNFKLIKMTHFSPIDKSYRGSLANLLRSKLKLKTDSYLFHNILYKIIVDFFFVPLSFIASLFKKGTFITIACVNEK